MVGYKSDLRKAEKYSRGHEKKARLLAEVLYRLFHDRTQGSFAEQECSANKVIQEDIIEKKLNVYSRRFCLHITEMVEMWNRYPGEEHWRSLGDLRDRVLTEMTKKSNSGGKSYHINDKPRANPPIDGTVSEKKLLKELQDLRQTDTCNRDRIEVLAKTTAEYEATISKLKSDLNAAQIDHETKVRELKRVAEEKIRLLKIKHANEIAEKDAIIAKQAAQLADFRSQLGSQKPVKKRRRLAACA